MMQTTDMKARVIKYLAKYPNATLKEASEYTGASRAYISRIRSQYKMYGDKRRPPNAMTLAIKDELKAQPELYAWLRSTCPENVELGQHIVSILVDAMLDDKAAKHAAE